MSREDGIMPITRCSHEPTEQNERKAAAPLIGASIDVDDARTVNPRAQKKAFAKAILEITPVRQLIDLGKPVRFYRNVLNRCLPSWIKFQGVYASFEEAQANAPKGVRSGYDHEEIAAAYEGQTFLPSDYPALFWLREALHPGARVFDFGGSVGVSFYAWQKYFQYPDNIRWLVHDLPKVNQAGQRLALEKKEDRLHFTSRFEDADGCDFILTSGSLQYIETPVSDFLRKLNRLPPHCVTLQNIRWMVSPYQVFLRDRFIASLEALGYELIDSWSDPDHTCWIPFYPEYSVEAYSGLYFRRQE
jgi:putative methyltransferase (TIGR04325 family)